MNDKPSKNSLNARLGSAVGVEIELPLQRRAPTPFADDLIDQLIEARKAKGWTQAELNAKLGAPDNLVSKWECRDRAPSGFLLWCWARALGYRMVLMQDDGPARRLAA